MKTKKTSIWYGFGNAIVDVVLDDAIREQVKKFEEKIKCKK